MEDESKNHHVPENSQTHFKVTLVSACFEGMVRVARHRKVNALLANEFNQGLHALSLHLHTPSEWENRAVSPPASPACRDGFSR